MYLHVGNGKSIKKEKIIGIFDLDTATVSSVTKNYINRQQKLCRVDYADSDLPRSFLLTEDRDGARVVLSRISTGGLLTRAEKEDTEEDE